MNTEKFPDLESRLQHYLDAEPEIAPDAYIAPGATVFGAVRLAALTSIWPGAVLRGDINEIVVGEGSNVQDGSIVHLADDYGVYIGKYVTIGHAAMIHACTIKDECLIGMQATILDGAVIGRRSIVGAGALVTGRTIIPPGSLVLGSPAKVVKTLSEEDQEGIREWADKYVATSRAYLKRGR